LNPPSKTVSVVNPETGMGWRFKNRLFEFGATVLGEIDVRIARKAGAAEIRKWLLDKYNGPIPIPTLKTIQAYIKWKRNVQRTTAGAAVRIRREMEKTETELREMTSLLNIAGLDISDRKGALERMAQFLLIRTDKTAIVQDSLMDPRFENNITGQIGEAHNIMQTLLKMEGSTGIQEFIARKYVEIFMTELAPIIKQAAEETYGPEKMKAFLERLNKGYAKIDFARIKKDAVAEATAHATGEIVDAIKTVRPVAR
jgi:hypothetical protein